MSEDNISPFPTKLPRESLVSLLLGSYVPFNDPLASRPSCLPLLCVVIVPMRLPLLSRSSCLLICLFCFVCCVMRCGLTGIRPQFAVKHVRETVRDQRGNHGILSRENWLSSLFFAKVASWSKVQIWDRQLPQRCDGPKSGWGLTPRRSCVRSAGSGGCRSARRRRIGAGCGGLLCGPRITRTSPRAKRRNPSHQAPLPSDGRGWRRTLRSLGARRAGEALAAFARVGGEGGAGVSDVSGGGDAESGVERAGLLL